MYLFRFEMMNIFWPATGFLFSPIAGQPFRLRTKRHVLRTDRKTG